MIDRFRGSDGDRVLLDAVMRQELVAHNETLARALAQRGQLVEYTSNQVIIEQNHDDNDLYFLLAGQVAVFLQGQHVATREAGVAIGEMAAIDSAARRSATVKALDSVVCLKVSSSDFHAVAKDVAVVWRFLAQSMASRLRERSRFHIPANRTPIMFLGSSVEGLKVADAIESRLKFVKVVVRKWPTTGIFLPSGIPLEDLINQANEADFAVFAFGPDDKIVSRGSEHLGPRDNLVFELGLFIGRLGRNRAFMVQDADAQLKLPTDLNGVTPITYKKQDGATLDEAIGTVASELRSVIERLGPVPDRFKLV